MDRISSLSLMNKSEDPLRIAIEPSAEQYKIDPGQTVEVVAGEQTESSIELVYRQGFLSIYEWSDDMKVMIDGEEMEMDFT